MKGGIILTPFIQPVIKVSGVTSERFKMHGTSSLKCIDRSNFFSNSRNFETEGDTPEKHGIKSLDPLEIYQFGLSFLVVTSSVSKLREIEKIRAVITFETAST